MAGRDINAAHIRLLAALRRPATREQLAIDEPMLMDDAPTTVGFDRFSG